MYGIAERNRIPLAKDYVVALYIRLSLEDDDLGGAKRESDSITNQRALLKEYLKNHEEFADCTVIEKCDDGYSGVHFDNRPQFTELIELAKKGKINCIMVKDFSRFGRDYIELGNYLDQIFPFLGIRFVSVNDGYDSAALNGETSGLDVAFKNLIYDYYSREMSKKQKIAWRRLAENGEYNASFTLYGYKKAPYDKHKLVIDEETAPVVREIFSMKLSGIGTTHIAKCLNDRGVPSPSELGRQRNIRQRWRGNFEKYGWTASTVERILREEKYTGTMIMLKTELQGIGGKQVKRPEKEWIRKEGTHEAIVSYQTYTLAVSMLKEQEAKEQGKNGRNIYYCGCCGRAMMNLHYGTLCCRNKRFETKSPCKDVAIRKADADMAVLQSIKKEVTLFLEEDKLRQQEKTDSSVTVAEQIGNISANLEKLRQGWMGLYDRYAGGEISREAFIEQKKEYDLETEKLEAMLSSLRQEEEQGEKSGDMWQVAEVMSAYRECSELTEGMKENLIDKVFVYEGGRIEVVWKYGDCLKAHSK